MRFIDLDAFERTPLETSPFDYVVVRNILKPEMRDGLIRDFPDIPHTGLLPAAEVDAGPSFTELLDELRDPDLTEAFGNKFGVDLSDHPIMTTVRARCDPRDGKIHTDSQSKLVTALIYLNPTWESSGGCLRLLRGPTDLEDYIAEVRPEFGTLIAFRRSDNSYHGHKPFDGQRRCVMFNWMADRMAARCETARHVLSARMKRLFSPARAGAGL